MVILLWTRRLHEYRERVKERAKAVDAEEEKQRLRGQVLGKEVDGPDVNAFLRQLGPDSKAVCGRTVTSSAILAINVLTTDL